MTIKITLAKRPLIKEPKWSVAEATPGEEVELSVTAENLTAGHAVEFLIRDPDGRQQALLTADGSHKAKWVAPSLPGEVEFEFDAVLREKPSAKTGFLSVRQSEPAADPLQVKGCKLSVTKVDGAFVPKQECLYTKFKIEGELPAKIRIEVWGERMHPGDEPIFAKDDFAAQVGDNEWKDWDGALEGGGFITAEHSPYRVRILLGPDEDSVKAPYDPAKGKGKVVLAESQFEVAIHKVEIRVQKDLAEIWDDKSKLRNVLAIEKTPAVIDGSYKVMGRLPKPKIEPDEAEEGRIRIPMANHWASGQLFDQGNSPAEQGNGDNLYLNKNYCVQEQKFTADHRYYTRPEIPLEFEVRLRSRKYLTEEDLKKKPGLFEPEALGPLRIEPFAEDGFQKQLYTGTDAVRQNYWAQSVSKVKQGAHDDPKHSGTNQPVVEYWQARFEIQNDDEDEFDVHEAPNDHRITDPAFAWVAASAKDELTVTLNRKRLFIAESDAEFDKKQKDFKIDPGADTTKIKLQKGLTRKGDILWIVRSVAAPAEGAAIPKWKAFPPGTNCPDHYGGIRGSDPNNLWLKNYSASAPWPQNTPGTDAEPIIGKPDRNAEFEHFKEKKYVELEPDPVDATKQERVELQVQTTGTKKGVAGVLFSPSFVAGDSYILHALIERCPFSRNFGSIPAKPRLDQKTGKITVWRTMAVHSSLRLPDVNTVGLAAADPGASPPKLPVGSVADAQPITGRPHPGDGRNMQFSEINRHFKPAFNEWIAPPVKPVIGASNATPIQITCPAHGLESGDVVWIRDVPSNTNANDTFVVEVDDANTFRLFARWGNADFTAPEQPVAANGELDPAGVDIFEPDPPVAVSDASNEAPIKIKTGADHGFATGQEVLIKDVKGNLAANGTYKITVGGAREFTLNDSDGTESSAYDSGGTVQRTNVTNTAPIRITTDADHGFSEDDDVAVIGAGGNTAANGLFKVHKLDARNLELKDSDGTTSSAYTGGGKVHLCGKLDCHRGVNLRKYANSYNGINGIGNGKLQIDAAKDIQNEFTPYDHYRTFLPPGFPKNRINLASNVIHGLPKGTSSKDAMDKVAAEITNYLGNPLTEDVALESGVSAYSPATPANAAPADLAAFPNLVGNSVDAGRTGWDEIRADRDNRKWDKKLGGGVTAVAEWSSVGSITDYAEFVDAVTSMIQRQLESVLIAPKPAAAQPKSMPVIRWPLLYHKSVWRSGRVDNAGAPQFSTTSVFTLGSASPGGTSRFQSQDHEPTSSTFTHEMGHACHLSHFVVDGNDFNWKQHHLLEGTCLMSYEHTAGYIPRPSAAVGPNGGTADTGWPDGVPPAAIVTVVTAGNSTTNEVQTLALSNNMATGGTINYHGAVIAHNASAAQVRTALGGLTAPADFVCTGGPLPQAVQITFQGGVGNRSIGAPRVDTSTLTGPFTPPQPRALSKARKDATYNTDDRTIAYLTNTTPGVARRVVGQPCSKCVLKLRGWKEEVLPCAWNHPDLF